MASLVDDLIRKRRAMGDAADNTDLLGRMITGVDKQTGLTLPDENIRAQCLTFLIAGHETTSGLLSFAIYFLLEHPEYLDRAREEVDQVLGGTLLPTFDQMHELTYIRQVLASREGGHGHRWRALRDPEGPGDDGPVPNVAPRQIRLG